MHLPRYLFLAATAAGDHLSVSLRKGSTAQPSLARRIRRETLGLDTLVEKAGHGLYFVNLQIGTPPQDVELALDTGSSDILVSSVEPEGSSSGQSRREVGSKTCKIAAPIYVERGWYS
jgi:hypothetical protein